MHQESIHNFLERFFTRNKCEVIHNDGNHLTVQLTIDMDKKLMNRPFYWHYLEKVGGIPNPAQLTIITNQEKVSEDIKGEIVHFGSPRLHQIFGATKDLGSFVRLYENINAQAYKKTPLCPWICVNFRISYHCDRRREVLLSLGLNLMNGTIVDKFQDKLSNLNYTSKIPDYSYTLQPTIKPQSGIIRMENVINQIIQNDDNEWAKEAKKRWNKDLDLLEKFFKDVDEKPESYYIEKKALKEQYEPRIIVDMINGGIFYLALN